MADGIENKAENQSNDIPEDWRILLDEFNQRITYGRSMGGDEKLAKRAAAGKANARQMIDSLVDQDSFMELGTLVGSMSYHGEKTTPSDALVGGLAKINGRSVVVGVEDFTVMGGSIGHGTNAKKLRLSRLALQERVPFVSILEGSGERTTNALSRHPYAPGDMQAMAELSGIVPTISLVVGPSAGHGAITGMLTDFIIMTEDSCMFAAGPPLVAAALGENVSKEDLGGAPIHTVKSGVAHNMVKDAEEGFSLIKNYLSFLPASAYATTPKQHNKQAAPRTLDKILTIVPSDDRVAYDMRKLITHIVDDGDQVTEIQADFGRSMITSLVRVGGYAVGIVANQPAFMAGSITADAAEKAAHFIGLCNAYHLPVIFLADNPGVMSGSAAEQAGTLRSAARMYAAQCSLTSPKLHVTLRKAFGFGSSLMAMNPFDKQTLSVAFPGITLGGIPALGGSIVTKVDVDEALRLKAAEDSGAWLTGDTMAYDEIIDPRELRNVLIRGLDLSAQRNSQNSKPVESVGVNP